jgi:Fe-S oxidoreductase
VVSDVNWNFSKFNTKFSTVWYVVPLSDGCQIHSEQVQFLGKLKQLQVKENFIIPFASATRVPTVPQTEYVWWLQRKGNYGMLSEIKYTKLPNKMYKIYEGESNENLKSVIKIRNTTRLYCKLATVIFMVWRVADRWQ